VRLEAVVWVFFSYLRFRRDYWLFLQRVREAVIAVSTQDQLCPLLIPCSLNIYLTVYSLFHVFMGFVTIDGVWIGYGCIAHLCTPLGTALYRSLTRTD
jgi:hypothetical protein